MLCGEISPIPRSESNKHGTRADLTFDLAVTFYGDRITRRVVTLELFRIYQGRRNQEEERRGRRSLVCEGLRVFVVGGIPIKDVCGRCEIIERVMFS